MMMTEVKINNMKSPSEFAQEIEDLVWLHDIDYIEAIVLYCETNRLDIETAASLIKLNMNIKGKVQTEAESLNYLPKISRLPV